MRCTTKSISNEEKKFGKEKKNFVRNGNVLKMECDAEKK